jgi:hypothetical protein
MVMNSVARVIRHAILQIANILRKIQTIRLAESARDQSRKSLRQKSVIILPIDCVDQIFPGGGEDPKPIPPPGLRPGLGRPREMQIPGVEIEHHHG